MNNVPNKTAIDSIATILVLKDFSEFVLYKKQFDEFLNEKTLVIYEGAFNQLAIEETSSNKVFYIENKKEVFMFGWLKKGSKSVVDNGKQLIGTESLIETGKEVKSAAKIILSPKEKIKNASPKASNN